MNVELLHYRRWQGHYRGPVWAVWPIARVALGMLFRRKLFWVLYAFSLLIFLMFFFGGLLMDWAIAEMPATIRMEGVSVPTERIVKWFREGSQVLNGSQATFRYFFRYQGLMLMVTLALTGALLIGNDFIHGSVPFYLAKPLSRWHYLGGKFLAVGVVVTMITTLPALGLFFQRGSQDWEYFWEPDYFLINGTGQGPASWPLLAGIIGYGLLLAVFLSIMLVAVASRVRRTVPLVLVWTTLFLFCRRLGSVLVDGLQMDERWRLVDLWNSLHLVGSFFLQMDHTMVPPQPQPETWEAALVLVLVTLLCLIYLNRRTRAVEVVK
jgi:hypothetical protein